MSKPTYEELRDQWLRAVKPFDRADCGFCLSDHRRDWYCEKPAPKPIRDAVSKAGLLTPCYYTIETFLAALPVFLRLRKRFARFYPKGK